MNNLVLYFHLIAKSPSHLILLDLVIRIVCGEEQKPWRLSLCNIISSPHYLIPQHSTVRHPRPVSSLSVTDQFHTWKSEVPDTV